ncbi:MAG TPA: MarR family transcriptional regulator [Herbaspirillum sp.]|jgi:DNA-binding MarR family transcriptional regulator
MASKKLGDKSSQAILRHWREAVPNDRLAHLIKDSLRGVSRALQVRLLEHSVSFGHWTFLRILWEHESITQRELSELAGVMEPTTFGALKSMETLGYITRSKLPHNKKNIYIELTPSGKALKKILVPLAERVNKIAVRGIPASDISTVRKSLLILIENLAADEPDESAVTSSGVLRHWREAVPNDRLAHLIKDSLRGVSRALQNRLGEHSVSFGQWTFLRILWEHESVTQRELSELAGVMEPTTFSALKSMETLGYITRSKLPHNKKNIYIELTPSGKALKKVLVPLAEQVNKIAVRGIPASDISTVRKSLLVLIENLAVDEQEWITGIVSTRDWGERINEISKTLSKLKK